MTDTIKPTCALCGKHPTVYRFRYFDGEREGQIIECCLHEYNDRLTRGEDLALMAGQEVKERPWPRP